LGGSTVITEILRVRATLARTGDRFIAGPSVHDKMQLGKLLPKSCEQRSNSPDWRISATPQPWTAPAGPRRHPAGHRATVRLPFPGLPL